MQISSDAVLFFGATGDLAHKKIFPALRKLAKRGRLAIPVIGVVSLDGICKSSRNGRKTVSRFTADWMTKVFPN